MKIPRTPLFKTILFIVFSVSAFFSTAQTIKGKVIDAQTQRPLAGANVYLNSTYSGAATDSAGNFALTAQQTNTPLIVNFVGYETQTVNNYRENKALVVALQSKNNQLAEVTIVADEMSREKKMKMFLKEFIGSINKDCIIANPDDVWLHYDKQTDVLTAGSDKPLLITNKRLGYKITYFMNDFRFAPLKTSYAGNYFFMEDTIGFQPEQISKILNARDDAYYGSRMFFIRALWANELSKNDLKMLEPTSISPRLNVYDEKTAKKITYNDVVGFFNDSRFKDQKYIRLKKQLAVLYKPKKRSETTSYLKPEDGYEGIFIDSKGYCGQGIGWNGDMGVNRISKLLPFEFMPQSRQ